MAQIPLAQSKIDELNALEKQYADYKADFEAWKEKNSRQAGTPAYIQYVDKFVVWEKDVDKRRQQLKHAIHADRNPSRPPLGTSATTFLSSSAARQNGADEHSPRAGQSVAQYPQNDETVEMLESLDPMAFVDMMMKMFNTDPMLAMALMINSQSTSTQSPSSTTSSTPSMSMPTLLTKKERLKIQEEHKQATPTHTAQSPPMPVLSSDYGYGGRGGAFGANGPYDQSDPLYRKWGAHAAPAGFNNSIRSVQPGAPLPPGWVTGEPIRKEQRFVNPKEYQLPKMPFRDFSMR